jgi:hypothetical protein
MSASNTYTFNLRSLFEKENLNGANFMDWCCRLRIVLRQEKTEYVITKPYLDDLPTGSTTTYHRAHEKCYDDAPNISDLPTGSTTTVSPDLQK